MPTYPGLSAEAFKHPLDQQAEQSLRSVPGFDLLASTFIEYFYERPQQIFLLGNSIQAGPRQYSTLYGIYRECLRDLDISLEPTLYVSQSPQVNSYALGQEQPYIVINTGVLELFEEDELRTILAHELGHIKCNHTLLIQMAVWTMGMAEMLGKMSIGLGSVVSTGLIYAFYEWRRKAELSADRAALLVTDDLRPITTTMMKLTGGSNRYAHECSVDEFLRQVEQYQELEQQNLNQLYRFLLNNGGNGAFLTHPFPIERFYYLRAWSSSPEYARIRQGSYARAGTEGSIEVDTQENQGEVERLRREVEALQEQINRIRRTPREN